MKKIIALLCVLACLMTCGCSKQEATASSAVEAYMQSEINEAKTNGLDSLDEMDFSEFEGFLDEETAKDFIATFTDFDYKVNKETVDGDSATVNMTITTYDYGTWMTNSLGAYIQQAFTLALSGASEEEIMNSVVGIFSEEFTKMKETGKNKSTDIDVVVNKVDGVWTVDEDSSSDAIANAMTGGMIEALEEFASGLEGMIE